MMLLSLFAYSTLGPVYTAPARAAQSFPSTTGITNEAVITVQFPNLLLQQSRPFLNSLQGQVKYYYNASYGKLSINYTVFGPYVLPLQEIYYGQDSGGQIDPNKVQFICDSLRAADQNGLNFVNFQHVTIVHAGGGQESTHNPDDIYSSWIGFSPACSGVSVPISRVVVASETSPIGTFTHEFGHDNGLPDLYDPATGSKDDYIGPWSLMASGNWLPPQPAQPGSSPASLDSWSKLRLNWIGLGSGLVPITNATANVTVGPLEIANQPIYAVKIPLSPTSYYLIEARRKGFGVDTAIPSEGVLVLLIDESKVGPNGFEAGVVLVEPHPNPNLDTAPLQPGQSFADPQSRVFIKVLSQAGLGYRIQITSHMLFVTLLGPLQVSATQAVSYIVRVTDERNNTKGGVRVTLTLDGRLLQQVTTDLAGNASLRVTFNWTDIGFHTLVIQTQALSNYIDGSQKATLQVALPSSFYPIIAAAIIVPIGLAVIRRRSKHGKIPPPNQWTASSTYQMPTNYCSQCGQPTPQGSSYCMYCGTRFA